MISFCCLSVFGVCRAFEFLGRECCDLLGSPVYVWVIMFLLGLALLELCRGPLVCLW